jgi:hypothetical protein
MLFPYIYVPHQMEKMQEFIDFIFAEVWCKAPIGLNFGPDLFDKKPDLREVMSFFGFAANAPERGKRFYKDIKEIYLLFSSLPANEIDQLRQWYVGNNDVEKVCSNDPTSKVIRYVDFPIVHKDLRDQVASFFKELYSEPLLGLAALKAKIGNIDDHYQAFVTTNKMGKCPFCGIGDLLGQYTSKREAYDHYLPKALYPFNSINFRNLVPACHHCNSSYKTSKDPACTSKDPIGKAQRRAVFYPYSTTAYTIELQVTLLNSDIANLIPADIHLKFGPAALDEKIDTWKGVYGIEERYKEKLCAENDGKYWLLQVFDEWQCDGKTSADFMTTLSRHATKKPYAECNFLRKPFLDACEQAGIFAVKTP